MAQDNIVSVILRLEQLRQFVSGSKAAADAVGKVGTEAEKSGKKARSGWTGLAKWAGGAAAMYGAYRFIKSSATATEDLGRSTLALTRSTKMDVQTASEWAGVLKVRHVQTNLFQRGLVQLARQVQKTTTATKAGKTPLEQLGYSINDATLKSGDFQRILMSVIDRLSKTKDPTKRLALAQQVLGRGAVALAPLFMQGSHAVQEQLDMQKKYGNYLTGKNQDAVMNEIRHQRELQVAYMGMQVQLGQALLPVMLSVTKAILKIVDALQPLLRHGKLLTALILGFAAAFVTLKVAMIAATVADTIFNADLTVTEGLLTLGIVPAIMLVIAAVVLLIKHWGWVHARLESLWGWVRSHWPLLLGILFGPFGIAAGMIIKHWQAVKKFVTGLVNWVIKEFHRLIAFFKGLPGRLNPFKGWGKTAKGIFGHVPGLAEGGVLQTAGGVMVGERGPELLSLPAGAMVSPLTGASPSPAAANAGQGDATITTQVFLDKREIARAVGRYTADRAARR